MQFKLEATEEGFMVWDLATDKALARVQTLTVVEPTTVDREGKTVYLPKVEQPLPYAKWVIHFCAGKWNPEDLLGFLGFVDSKARE